MVDIYIWSNEICLVLCSEANNFPIHTTLSLLRSNDSLFSLLEQLEPVFSTKLDQYERSNPYGLEALVFSHPERSPVI
jgi:hypothetical protein